MNTPLVWTTWTPTSAVPKEAVTLNHSLTYINMYIKHYGDVIMNAITSQITSLAIVYSTVYSDADQRNHQSSASLAFVRVPGEFPAQMASNAENVSIWWRHHETESMHITPHNSRLVPAFPWTSHGGFHDSGSLETLMESPCINILLCWQLRWRVHYNRIKLHWSCLAIFYICWLCLCWIKKQHCLNPDIIYT